MKFIEKIKIGDCTLMLGDSINCLPIAADAVVSDVPYGIAYFHSGGCSGKTSTLKGNGAMQAKAKSFASKKPFILGDDVPFDPSPWLAYETVVLFGANHYSHKLPPGGKWITWDKIENPEHYGKLSFSDCEMIWTNKSGPARIFKQLWQGCRRRGESNIEGKLHPNQKPVALLMWLMAETKIPDAATVLDPYMGSGTTGIACIRTGRKFIGIEKDPVHFQTAVERIRRELNQPLLVVRG